MEDVRGKDGAHNERESEVIKRTKEKVKEENGGEVNVSEPTENKETKLQWHPAFYAEIQIELEEKNFWLKNLTDDLKSKKMADKIVEEYEKHKNDIYYRSVMDIIVRANRTMFREEYGMCDAMMEILKDRIDELNQKAREDGEKNGKKEGIYLAKMIMRMDAEGLDCVAIAEKCLITVEEVKEILAA